MFPLMPVRCRSAGLAVTSVASKEYKARLEAECHTGAAQGTAEGAWLDAEQKAQSVRCGYSATPDIRT